jgi:hypothetical protein
MARPDDEDRIREGYDRRDRDDRDDDRYEDRDDFRYDDDDRGDYRLREPIPTYLVQSILITLFCCTLGGIIALVNAAQVDGKVRQGRYAEARQLSDRARLWCLISFIIGFLVNLVVAFVTVADMGASLP